jgi:hypothetical protein
MNTALRIVENPIDRLLSRLESVRKAGSGYTARCPAHSDRSASLSVSEAEGGKVLIHCFAGCETADVMAAVGLTLAELFPARLRASTPEERRAARLGALRANWSAALGVLALESTIAVCACETMLRGEPLDESDRIRLHLAYDRIHAAREILNVRT